MRWFYKIVFIWAIYMPCGLALDIPQDIQDGIRRSSVGESGGYFVNGVERSRFKDYISNNWREIVENIEILPPWDGEFRGNEQRAITASVMSFGAACEWLPPEEYIEFLEKFVGLAEEGRIQYRALETQLIPMAKKVSFLEVNYSHPRVKAVLDRAIKLVPPEKNEMREYLMDVRSGGLSDNYLEGMPDDFRPETLPGVKLKRPWGSLLKRYERLSGKKAPPDPEFPEEDSRARRRPDGGNSDNGEVSEEPVGFWVEGVILLLFGAGIFFWRRHRRILKGR